MSNRQINDYLLYSNLKSEFYGNIKSKLTIPNPQLPIPLTSESTELNYRDDCENQAVL